MQVLCIRIFKKNLSRNLYMANIVGKSWKVIKVLLKMLIKVTSYKICILVSNVWISFVREIEVSQTKLIQILLASEQTIL